MALMVIGQNSDGGVEIVCQECWKKNVSVALVEDADLELYCPICGFTTKSNKETPND